MWTNPMRTLTGGPAEGASVPSYADCRRAILSAMNFSPLSLEGDQKHTLASRPPDTKCLPLPTKASPAWLVNSVSVQPKSRQQKHSEHNCSVHNCCTCHSGLVSLHGMLHHVQPHIVDCNHSIFQPKRNDVVVLQHVHGKLRQRVANVCICVIVTLSGRCKDMPAGGKLRQLQLGVAAGTW